MLFPESSALLTLNPQYSVLFLERSLLPENLFGAVPFTGLPKLLRRSPRSHWKSPGLSRRRISTAADIQAKCNLRFSDTGIGLPPPRISACQRTEPDSRRLGSDGLDGERRRRSFLTAVSIPSPISTRHLESGGSTSLLFQSPILTGTGNVCRWRGWRYPDASAGFRRRTGGRFCRC